MAKVYTLLILVLIGFSSATVNHVLVIPGSTAGTPCHDRTCYSLQHVRTHYEFYFVSNTTIELLPGQYVVNESFGSIVIKDIEHFVLIGASGDNASTIYCTIFSTLSLVFVNVKDVSISSMHFSCCIGDKPLDIFAQLTWLPGIKKKYFDFNKNGNCTLGFVISSDILVSKVFISHVNGIGIIALGVSSNFNLSQSILLYNRINCMILTHAVQLESKHEYQIFHSWFMHGNFSESKIASGISVILGHEGTSTVQMILSNVTLLNNRAPEGNLLFTIGNCELVNTQDLKFQTTVDIVLHNIILKNTREEDMTKGLVVTYWAPFECFLRSYMYRTMKINLTIENSKFIQCCIELNINYLLIRQAVVEQASCTCQSAMSITSHNDMIRGDHNSKPWYIKNLSIMDSCGSESLMNTVSSYLIFQGKTNFFNNSGKIFFQRSYIIFKDNTTITKSSSNESPLWAEETDMKIEGNISFVNNSGSQCGGMKLVRSNVFIQVCESASRVIFVGNHGHDGGAIAMYDKSQLRGNCFDHRQSVVFKNNVAKHLGGAIFTDDPSYESGKYHHKFELLCSIFDFTIMGEFLNNTANLSGDSLYGGWIDVCKIDLAREFKSFPTRVAFSNLKNSPTEPSIISSNPSRICWCINSTPQCNITHYKYKKTLSPGQSVNVQAVAVGQRFGTVPSTVIAQYINSSAKILEIQHLQNVGRYCTMLTYTITSQNDEENLLLTVEKKFIPELDSIDKKDLNYRNKDYYREQLLVFDQLIITLTISDCPLGYSFDNSTNTCICQETLTQNNIECHIENQTVIRKNLMWINATFVHTGSKTGKPGVIVHLNCPFDYCKNLKQQYLDLQYSDDQCAFGRSGILCGECPQNYSQVFGTSMCKKCSNLWILLVIPLFLLTGIGLVALLILLNLTVSTGTINGLIFYAHIVRANQASFFPPQMTNTFLSWFIAWLNLDLGIQMCFFHGLDAYVKTWLQFLFPIYIWLLVIVIILSSHYYTFAARISGTNAVQVLATLFLMSYAKMLRITITVLSSTTLRYPDGYKIRVWLYDANVEYLKGKHIPLFIAALLLLIVLSVPYTLVLLCIQWLRLLPSYRILFWVRKFMPLFDAYTGVYKRQHGYWTGLLLLVRVGLFLIFSLNVLGDPSINLLTVATTTFCLFTYLAIFGGVYRQRHLNVIEYSYLLNLGILSAVTDRTKFLEHIQEKVIKTSVGIALWTFILIVLCHAFLRLKSTQKGGIFFQYLNTNFTSPLLNKLKSTKVSVSANLTQQTANNTPQHTRSSIELRESLLLN